MWHPACGPRAAGAFSCSNSDCGHRLGRWGSDVAGGWADEAVVRGLLHDMGAPADGPSGGEGRCEHVPGDGAEVHDHAGVVLHVGVQVATGLQFGQGVDNRLFNRQRQLHQGAAERGDDVAQQQRPRIVGLVDAVAESHDPFAAFYGGADEPFCPLGRTDLVEHVEDSAGRPPVQGTRQRTDGSDHGGGQVGAGRGDDPAGEGRGIEAVVDGQDHVLLQRPSLCCARHGAREHVKVVGRHAQVVPRRHRLLARAEPIGRRQNGRHHRAQPEGLVMELRGCNVVRRLPFELGAEHGDRGPQHIEGLPQARKLGEQVAQARRHGATPPHLIGEGSRCGQPRQLAAEQEVPDVFERALPGQVDSRVLPVVEEALLTADVADRRLGHDHAFQSGRHVATGLGGRTDAGHAEEVTQRDHPDQAGAAVALAFDDRQVPVVMGGQARPGGVDLLVRAEDVRVGGHPEADALRVGAARGGGGPQQVTLGQDPGHLPVVGDHDGSGIGFLHDAGSHGEGVGARAGHGGRGHQGADVGVRGHGSTMPPHAGVVNVDQVNIKSVCVDRMLPSEEAARRLGVKVSTLYAYVSRGVIESHPDPGGPGGLGGPGGPGGPGGRRSLFDLADIERLAARGRGGRQTESRLATVTTRVTQLRQGGPFYRGQAAPTLVGQMSFEEVAALLWECDPDGDWSTPALGPCPLDTVADRMRWTLVMCGAADPLRADLRAETVIRSSRRVIAALVQAVGVVGDGGSGSIAQRLAHQLGASSGGRDLAAAVDAALILMADHELATSTVAVRLAASTRADIYDALMAGLATLAGPLHGGASQQAYELLAVAERDGVARALNQILGEHRRLPGFGHMIYTEADPRFDALMAAARPVLSEARWSLVRQILELAADHDVPIPNCDLALAALTWGTDMPSDAGRTIFTVARIAGWTAHYMEELGERPVRFRARAVYSV